ncbi:TatD family hydrolase [Verrucomicrobia bacterium]|nr:TatD family hydrolase [Verrucomicrobiota bacterium]
MTNHLRGVTVALPTLGQAMPEFYDTHAHLDFPDFREEVDEVVQRAADAGISRIVTIGTEQESSRRAIDLAKRFDGVFAAVGWHPNDCLFAPDDVRGELERLAKAPKVVAIGEIGIDHYRLPSTRGGSAADDEAFKARQVSLFQQQLEVAAKLGLNVVVHQRASFDACIEVFEPFADRVRGVFHCFVNDPAAARRVIDLGSLVSFTGVCTFKNAGDVRESLASVPLDKLMLETDAPFLAPVPYRGKRCEPAYVREISQVASETRGIGLEELAEATGATARDFFKGLE